MLVSNVERKFNQSLLPMFKGNKLSVTLNGSEVVIVKGMISKRIKVNNWEVSEYNELYDLLNAYECNEVAWNSIEHYDDNAMNYIPEYNKVGFFDGCSSFMDMFNRMAECGFSGELIKSMNIDMNKTEAIVYNGMYITPCMLDSVMNNIKAEFKINDTKGIKENIINTLKSGRSLKEDTTLKALGLV